MNHHITTGVNNIYNIRQIEASPNFKSGEAFINNVDFLWKSLSGEQFFFNIYRFYIINY